MRLLVADNASGEKEALKLLEKFLDRLAHVRILDPACGTGNFLYVSLDVLKRIENEVLDMFSNLGGGRITSYGRLVSPKQFLGIEIKRWAKEIAELVLWIGYLQWQLRTRGFANSPEEPILHDYHNIECRDAVLAYDEKVRLLDDDGNSVTRWDGETMKRHPVTGEEVPDDSARIPVYRYVNPRKAEWPEAEFIVGNPPFIGDKMMKQALGSGYVEALRLTYGELGDSSDYVVYWWDKAALQTEDGPTKRFGFIATNSLRQAFNRRVLTRHIDRGLCLIFAVPDHPWVDDADGADVRISMTVAEIGQHPGTLQTLTVESRDEIRFESRSGTIYADLTIGPNVLGARALKANDGLACVGVKLFGQGFVLTRHEAADLGLGTVSGIAEIIRPYRIGKDISQHSRDGFVIDAFGWSEKDLQALHPQVFQWLIDHVKQTRDSNARASYREKWWIFGEPRKQFRPALRDLLRFIVTLETSTHRFFVFMEAHVVPEGSLVVFADDDAFALGTLSSRVHTTWALAAGGRLGVGNDPRYNKTRCFDPFPFPDGIEDQRQRIRDIGEQLDAHRKRQQSLHPDLTITGMYNVLEELRSGEALTEKEKVIHEQGLVSVLKQIHDDLDAAVFDAYGWPHDLTDEQILERLVALNAERAEEERRGIIRWLRPEFQNPAGAKSDRQTTMAGIEIEEKEAEAKPKAAVAWPKDLPSQISAVRDLVTGNRGESWTVDRTAKAFKGAKRPQVQSVLDSLAALGLLVSFGEGTGREWRSGA